MNIVVTGSLGNISKPLTEELVQQGHSVTVISSSPDRQTNIKSLGATATIGYLQDSDFLTATFTGADAVYCMVPPNFAAPDMRAYYREIGNSYAQSIRQSGVKRVVHLSSWGAHADKGTGFILGSHDVENILNELPDLSITHLRAGSFYTNFYNFIGMIKYTGHISTNYGGDDLLVMVHPTDIAAAATEELVISGSATPGVTIRYVASDEFTPTESARALGAAIGKPDLTWVLLTDEQAQAGLEQNGVPPYLATLFVELNAAIHNGLLREDYDLRKPARMGKVKLTDFAREFAAAYKQQ
jgi:uncharacterized protein YbjT (DUF2867 family)